VPINRIPPEILSLIPHFWEYPRDKDVITLTHVCQAWRDVFVSSPSLWTDLDCMDLDKTRVYLERSKSSPIDLSLHCDHTSFSDPSLEFIPHVAGRLKSLTIQGGSEHLQDINTYLFCPAPLLEALSIYGGNGNDPELPPTFLNGDFSPLHILRLEDIRTELPWRNMVNLTSFTLVYGSNTSISQFLEFFESAPRLRDVHIYSEHPVTTVEYERLVPMTCLTWMESGGFLGSNLFDHLLIPVGTDLKMRVDLPNPIEGTPPPKFIDNLKNLPEFTSIWLQTDMTRMLFSGPNGKVSMTPLPFDTSSMLKYLAYFDTSKTERLVIQGGEPPTGTLLYQSLLPMKGLRTLKLIRCEDPHTFVRVLHPSMSSSGVMVCPELEELVIEHKRTLDIKVVEGVAAARASSGAKLKVARIISWYGVQVDTSELKNHVSRVEIIMRSSVLHPGEWAWVFLKAASILNRVIRVQ